MADFIDRRIEAAVQNNSLNKNVKLLPTHLGAKVKDFQRAKWLATDLAKKQYFEISESKEMQADPPHIVLAQKHLQEKLKEDDQFEEKIVQIFDPFSLIAKETSRLTDQMQNRVYNLQTKHTQRLM